MSKIQELKAWLKAEGKKLPNYKINFKNAQRANGPSSWKKEYEAHCTLNEAKSDYRHHHIAYSELRGKSREQIECPREHNEPSEYEINRIKEEYAWSPEEIIAYEERQAKFAALKEEANAA